ncbi:MAG TPA: dolichyl-phosphate beta-glucosyltransferase [Chthoniobacterales bacterium]|jgi:glycosyltransferase involved in cell wall biosynthesis|nr:dolichyl-phosphate beta-glucosyltransferase [Chthoniobacterales bacterium]
MLPPFTVTIPCYNEAARIGDTVRLTLDYLAAESPEAELIVVNDGSTDSTSAIVGKALAGAKVRTQFLENFPNRGKGAAVRSGLLAATRPIGLFFDADLSTPLSEIPKVIEPIARDEVDVAFGSRALDRKLIGIRQPWRREQAGRVFNLIVRIATGMPFWDTQCGFKAFRLDVCRPILEKAHTIGFAFDVELLFMAYRAGLRLREVPVRWNHSEGSKVRVIHDSLAMLREVIALRLSS